MWDSRWDNTRFRWPLNPLKTPYKRQKDTQRSTGRKLVWRQRQRWQFRCHKPRKPRNHWASEGTRKDSPLRACKGSVVLPTSSYGTAGVQDCTIIHFCHLATQLVVVGYGSPRKLKSLWWSLKSPKIQVALQHWMIIMYRVWGHKIKPYNEQRRWKWIIQSRSLR